MNHEQDEKKMKSIWYFVGLMLLTMGVLVLVAGILMVVSGKTGSTVLAHLHPDIWWGAVMIAAGSIFFFKNRRG